MSAGKNSDSEEPDGAPRSKVLKRVPIEARILEWLETGPAQVDELASAIGCSSSTIGMGVNSLAGEGKVRMLGNQVELVST